MSSIDLGKYSIERLLMLNKSIEITKALTDINNVFDMACNNGYWINTAQRLLPNTKFIGMDTQNLNDRGWKDFKNNNVEFFQGNSLDYLKDKQKSFDMVLSMGVMYYYSDILDFIKTITDASRTTVLIDTFCLNSEDCIEKRVKNPSNEMVKVAKEPTEYVTIPSESKIMEYFENLGFLSYKVDKFTDHYNDSVGSRLNLDLKRSAIIGIKKRDYVGQSKYRRTR